MDNLIGCSTVPSYKNLAGSTQDGESGMDGQTDTA